MNALVTPPLITPRKLLRQGKIIYLDILTYLEVDGIPAPSTPCRLIKKQSLMRGRTGIRKSPKWATQCDWSKIFVSQNLIG